MMELLPLEMLWRTALAAIPLALLVAFIGRTLPCRPSTRHLMWVSLVVILICAPFLPRLSDENTQVLRETAGELVAKAAQLVPEIPAPPDARIVQNMNMQPWGGDPLLDTRLRERSIWDEKNTDAIEPSHIFSAQRSLEKDDAWSLAPAEKSSFDRPSARQSDRKSAAFFPTTFDEIREVKDLDDASASHEVDWDQVHTELFSEPLRSAPNDSLAFENSRRPSESFAPSRAMPMKTGAIETEQTKGTVEPSPLPPAHAESLWNAWLAQLAILRDAVLNLPPIPGSVWFGGMALLLLVLALRVGESLRFLRLAKPAPHRVTQEVRRAAKDIGLKRMPTTLMVEARISPMVWCGRKVLLVLPESLWEQLDEVGRGAVIRHELAHLRRRDHWVAWVDLAAGILYWWHPVMWWIRRRIREEADLSCDAWVTALVPGSRRAYAEALLETKKFVSTFVPAGPATGLGVTKLRAKTFARRLKMVMTEQKTPGWSLAGVALAAILLVVGCIVTPIWACPPDEKPKTAYKTKDAKSVRIVAPSTQCDEAEDEDASTFERYMHEKGDDKKSKSKTDSHKRVVVSAPAVKAGKAKGVETCCEGECCCCCDGPKTISYIGTGDGVTYTVSPQAVSTSECQVTTSTECQATSECTIIVQEGKVVQAPANVAYNVSAQSAAKMSAYAVVGAYDEDEKDEDVSRMYSLPDGKLQALIDLMVREDVPVLVRPHDDVIEVFGTSRQQKIFKAFVNLIHPEGADGEDIVIVEVEEGDWEEHAEHAEHAEHSEHAEHDEDWDEDWDEDEEDEETYEAWEDERHLDHAREWEQIVRQHEQQMKQLHRQIEQVHRQQERMHDRADAMREKADEMRDKADEMRDKADELQDEADEVESDSKEARLLQRVESYEQKAEELEDQAESFEDEAEAMEDEAESLEDQAEEIEDQAEELEEQLEELEEEFEGDEDDEDDEDDGCDDDDDDDEDDDDDDDDWDDI